MHFLCGFDTLLVKLDELQMESLLDAVKALEAKGLLRKGGREAGEEEQEKVVDIITHVLGRVHRRQSFKCGRERVKFYLAPAKLDDGGFSILLSDRRH